MWTSCNLSDFDNVYLELGLLRIAGTPGAVADFQRQVGHFPSQLNQVIEGAEATELHHNGQLDA